MQNICQVIQLKEGDRLTVDQQTVGYTITGPATVFVVKEEAAAVTTASDPTNDKYNQNMA